MYVVREFLLPKKDIRLNYCTQKSIFQPFIITKTELLGTQLKRFYFKPSPLPPPPKEGERVSSNPFSPLTIIIITWCQKIIGNLLTRFPHFLPASLPGGQRRRQRNPSGTARSRRTRGASGTAQARTKTDYQRM